MTTDSYTLESLAVAREQVSDRIQAMQVQHSTQGERPVEGALSVMQHLHGADVHEARLDSLRQFRWHLALVLATVDHN